MAMEKTFDAAEAEPRLYADWEAKECFKAGAGARPGAESYSIVIPPPNVTGSLHMGHALNNTLQDVLIRWKRMQGFDVLWQPGTDHAGIATQMVVERQLAETQQPGRRDMGREAFVQKIWEWKEESGGTILNQLKRLGASCDWSRERFTMDEGLSKAVSKVFVELYREGLIYKDKRLVNWDPVFETAISDMEVEQLEVDGKLWRFRYPLGKDENGEQIIYNHPVTTLEDGTVRDWKPEDGAPDEFVERDYLVVATTRPETMLGDSGVAVHPEDARYEALVGHRVILPLVGRSIPIVADDYADPTTGTGAVKMTPAHDFNDFQVGKRRLLRNINVMTPKAALFLKDNADFLEDCDVPPETMALDGLDRFAARKRVVAMLKEAGLLDGVDEHPHTVPHGDRSKAPIEPYLTDQWFADAATLAKEGIAAVKDGRTTFHPKNWEKTYFHWMENIEPWCVSRQLWWGHQIPVWYGPEITEEGDLNYVSPLHPEAADKEKRICALNEHDALKEAQKIYGLDVQIVASYDEALLKGVNTPGGATCIWRDPDVLDTWFSSALWPFSTLGWPDETPELARYYPTSVLVTGFDIISFWVARMMKMAFPFMKEKPFDDVYIHALVLDEHGKKMSKSIGNVIDPLDLIGGIDVDELVRKRTTGLARPETAPQIDKQTRAEYPDGFEAFGADALRFTLTSMAAMGRDIKLSVDRIKGYRNFGTKLWNAARFCEMNACARKADFDPRDVDETVNKWIIGETARLRVAMDEALGAYRFNDAAGALYAHVWGVFCDWYVEMAKPLLQGDDGAAKEETRATAAWALDQCCVLMHPIMPFITEEIWRVTGGEGVLMHADWPEYGEELVDREAEAETRWAISLIEAVRSVRSEMNVPPSARIPLVLTEFSMEAAQRLLRNGAVIRRMARLSEAAVADNAPEGSIVTAVEEATINLPLADVIDVSAEKGRLEKSLTKLEKELKGLESKLSNQAFLAKAPAHVVEEQRERLAVAKDESEKLRGALARLAAMG